MSLSKIIYFFLVLSFVSLCLVNVDVNALAQIETTLENTVSTEAVTSVNDAILKSLVIISQVAVLGILFNYFIFNWFLNKKRDIRYRFYELKQQSVYFDVRTLKRVSFVVILCCVTLVIFSTCIILLQSYQLSQTMDLDIYSAFDILFSTSVGQVWLLRVLTSFTIIATIVLYYFTSNARARITNQMNDDKHSANKIHFFRKNKLNQIFLLGLISLSSLNLFSNSMVSHSNSLSSFSVLAVSMDWIHFMAVSIWIGGLFYLSLIFLKNIKPVEYDGTVNRANSVSDISNDLVSIHNVSISLMYFSFVIIIALCVIGISGLILGFMHLQDLNSLFGTSYGQILVLKLGLVFPLIFIGRYNQLKIYKNTSLVSFLVKNKGHNDTTDSISDPYQQTRDELFKKLNRSLKIESLLGIAVLIVAAFLSVTSPPSLEATDQDTFNIQSSNVSESGSSFFFLLVISLVVIISIIGVVNFRKNQKQVKEIFAITGDGN